jgi:hypothetical protein
LTTKILNTGVESEVAKSQQGFGEIVIPG